MSEPSEVLRRSLTEAAACERLPERDMSGIGVPGRVLADLTAEPGHHSVLTISVDGDDLVVRIRQGEEAMEWRTSSPARAPEIIHHLARWHEHVAKGE